MEIWIKVGLGVAAYLLGAIPFGLLLAKTKGVNIREHGSGNIGATNVFRVMGKGWGIFTFVLDALKGFVPAFVFPKLCGGSVEVGLMFGFAAILGHTFSVFLKFKGGKGVATSAGMLLGVAPPAVGIGFVSWVLCMVLSRYVSLSSIVASIVVAIAGWFFMESMVVRMALILLGVLVIWLHRGNIQRLMHGTENRFGKQKETSS